MSARRAALAAAPLVVLAPIGCRAIAGLHDLTYAAAVCGAPVLPSSGDARVRLVNAGTSGAADFCIRASGTKDWGAPILAATSGSAECASGLDYARATMPFAAPAGAIDVKAIAVGARCDAPALSELAAAPVGGSGAAAPVVTLLRFGGGSIPERIVALPEEPSSFTITANRVRYVNAIATTRSINVGVTAGASLPADIGEPMLATPIPPGGTSVPGEMRLGRVDSYGYCQLLPAAVTLGIVFDGDLHALFIDAPGDSKTTHTVYAIGDPADATHAVRGLRCDDAATTATAATTGGDPDASAAAGVFAPCTLSTLPTIAVDTVNPSFFGGDAPFESERRAPVIGKIAARTSDVMCIVEVPRPEDRRAIAEAAKAQFPYAYAPTPPFDLDTQPTDPRNAAGEIPPAPTGPPCDGVPSDQVDAVYACANDHCVDPSTGALRGSIQCLPRHCTVPFSKLFRAGDDANRCFDCILDYFTSYQTAAFGRSECVGDARRPFAFVGQNPSMILSRYPLKNTRAFVLPSTDFRRSVLYAEVELEDQSVDFYCAQLSSSLIADVMPYEGVYGTTGLTTLPDGGTAERGWEDEQELQVRRVIDFVHANTAATGNAAIVAGDWHASRRATDAGGQVVVDEVSPGVVAALDASLGGAFQRASPAGATPFCTACPAPQNPYNSGQSPLDVTTTYLLGFAAGAATDERVWGTEIDLPIHGSADEPPPPGGMGPGFEFYPRVVRVVRPPKRR